MAITIEDVERLIRAKGLRCERISDAGELAATMPTKAYRDSAGRSQLEVRIRVDEEHNCLVMETPGAFDSRKAVHKEAMFSCLLGALSNSPLVRPQYDPQAGEVRLRVDGLLDGGVTPGNVVTMLESLPAFADSVYPQLAGMMRSAGPARERRTQPSREQRLAEIARRAGGVNRLAALFRMRRRRPDAGGEPSAN